MKKGYKILSLLLIIALCVNFIPLVVLNSPIQAADTWTKHAGNPFVLGTEPLSGEASVVYDANTGLYKMWFTKGVSSPAALNTFISNLITAAGAALVTDLKAYNFTNIANNDSLGIKTVVTYIAGLAAGDIQNILQSARPSIVYATSPDGITWTLQAGGLTGTVGAWDGYGVTSPSVIINSASNYEMWYNGWDVNLTAVNAIKQLFVDLNTLSAPNIKVLLTDLLITKNPGQFFTDLKTIGGAGYPTTLMQDVATILENSGGSIGYATSTDGINWVKSNTNGTPGTGQILTKGAGSAWDNFGVYSPAVVKTTSGYQMWYTGLTVDMTPFTSLVGGGSATYTDISNAISNAVKMQTGMAKLTAGTWVKEATNPVMLTNFSGAAGPLKGVACPSVLVDSSGLYQMWYTNIQADPGPLLNFLQGNTTLNTAITASSDISIWKATSANGITWGSPTQALVKGTGNVWDNLGIGAAGVISKDSFYKMWYTGIKSNAESLITNLLNNTGVSTALTNSSSSAAIGLATFAIPQPPPPPPPGGGPGTGPTNLTTSSSLSLVSNVTINSNGVVQSNATINTQSGDLSLNIPQGTTILNAQGQPLTYISADPISATIIPPPPPGNAIVLTYNLGPAGATFQPYLTLTLNYDPAKLLPGTLESSLVITFWDGNKWQTLESTVDPVTHTVSAKVTHFTVFAIQSLKTTITTPTPSAPVATPTPTAPATTKPPVTTPPATTTTPPAKPAEEAGLAWWIIVIIVVAVAAIGFVAFWRMRSKKQT